MNHTTPTADCGVIVGRFQVAELHQGHRDLIDTVVAKHRKVIIVLGRSPLPNSWSNPLDYQARMQMIQEAYPDVVIAYINDIHNNERWSYNLDKIITDILTPTQTALLYGSRDSFIPYYSGRYPTFELDATRDQWSGTADRLEIGRVTHGDKMWRSGVIWASRNRFPTCYTTVDCAIFDETYEHILLGKKPFEDDWRLPGGFSDPCSDSFEEDAARECKEETGLDFTKPVYLWSTQIDDWRYTKEPDCIKTMLFAGVGKGDAVAGDDLEVVQWFPVSVLDPQYNTTVMRAHRKLTAKAYIHAGRMARTD